MIIQIIGLPGAGKTALATALADRINAIHFNADDVRDDLNSDLGSALIAFWETIVKVGIYYWHERIWDKISWGRKTN